MGKGRLEAFSDGVFAIIITIMVLELKVPHGSSLVDLAPLWPKFLSYILSFIYVGIYWNNHHHMLHASHQVTGTINWLNIHLLFWLSLIPFGTAWMGENHFASTPVSLYGVPLLFAGIAYYLLERALIQHHGKGSELAKAVGADKKGILSVIFYAAAIPLAFVDARIACAIYVLVALMWIIPDRRVEKVLRDS